jgi:hypothetical protein
MENQQNNFPEVKLGQYKGLAVTRHVRGISEKTLDIEMVHQTRMRATYHNSTEAAKRGSRVLLAGVPIAVGGVVYLLSAIVLKVLTKEDCLLLPKGQKIAKILKL